MWARTPQVARIAVVKPMRSPVFAKSAKNPHQAEWHLSIEDIVTSIV
jgi:hypothetical protein